MPGHSPGRNWIEIFVGLAAVTVSVISLWVGVRTEKANEDMVAATTWPMLQYSSSNLDSQNQQIARLEIINGGVGPAKLIWLEMYYRGKPMAGPYHFLKECCGSPPSHAGVETSVPNGYVIRAGENVHFITVRAVAGAEQTRTRLDEVRRDLTFRACYCSVLDKCWISDLVTLTPNSVDRCPAPATPYQG